MRLLLLCAFSALFSVCATAQADCTELDATDMRASATTNLDSMDFDGPDMRYYACGTFPAGTPGLPPALFEATITLDRGAAVPSAGEPAGSVVLQYEPWDPTLNGGAGGYSPAGQQGSSTPFNGGNITVGQGQREGRIVILVANSTIVNDVQITITDFTATTVINFTTNLTLPVELSGFTGKSRGKSVELKWATASEQGNEGFEVQRQQLGTDWATIDFVPGKGNAAAEYAFDDVTAPAGMNYYRLKQMDFDGAFAFSPVISVDVSGAISNALSVYPNPAQNELQVQLAGVEGSPSVRVMNNLGAIVRETVLTDGRSTIDVSDLAAGPYLVSVMNGERISTQRFIKR